VLIDWIDIIRCISSKIASHDPTPEQQMFRCQTEATLFRPVLSLVSFQPRKYWSQQCMSVSMEATMTSETLHDCRCCRHGKYCTALRNKLWRITTITDIPVITWHRHLVRQLRCQVKHVLFQSINEWSRSTDKTMLAEAWQCATTSHSDVVRRLVSRWAHKNVK